MLMTARAAAWRTSTAAILLYGVIVVSADAGLQEQSAGASLPKDLGTALAGWEAVTDPPTPIAQVCAAHADGVIAVSGSPVGYIATTTTHRDYRLHAEWRWADKPGNGGALVHITSGPRDRQWPVCFQIQWKHGAVGDMLPMAGAAFLEALTSPPGAKTPQRDHMAADSERPLGDWNTCEIVCRRDTIEVTINAVVQNRVSGASATAGKVGFQLEGTPFELRRVTIAPLR
jgi:hypothetical protein